jgi:hypothetical protein
VTLGLEVCCDGSDPLALLRVFSRALARVTQRDVLARRFREFRRERISTFAGALEWAGQDSNLRPWD